MRLLHHTSRNHGLALTKCQAIFLSAALLAVPALAEVPPSAYVVSSGGHLSRGGERIRLWGVNVDISYFKSYDEIDALVDRLKALGFNAVRLWPGIGTFYTADPDGDVHHNVSEKGDGSNLDRFDYFVYKATSAGLLIHMTALHYFDLPTLRAIKKDEISAWVKGTRDDAQLRIVHGFAPYISSSYRKLLLDHQSWVLHRVNPYLNAPYSNLPCVSTWELANESRFIETALSPEKISELPPIAYQALSEKWATSPFNRTHRPLPPQLSDLLSSIDASAYRRFVVSTFVDASNEMRALARGTNTRKTGVAIQPFVFTTGPAEPVAPAQYAYSQGDASAIGWYRSPLQNMGLNGTPWMPISVSGARPILPSIAKLKNKPLIIYETSFFRPLPYRAEWGPFMLGMALQQDWDAVFLYQYGQPKMIYTQKGQPEGYGQVPLPEPVSGDPDAGRASYTFGFHHGGDPTVMASWSVASIQFTSVRTNAPPKYVWDVSLEEVYSSGGYPRGLLEQAKTTSLTESVALNFVTDSVATRCHPCEVPQPPARDYKVDWPSPDRPLTISTPVGTSITGALKTATLGFRNIRASVVKPGFGTLALLCFSACDTTNPSVTAWVIGNAVNSGMAFNEKAVDFSSPVGAMRGTLSRGGLPLQFSGPSVDIEVIGDDLQFVPQNFGLRSMSATNSPSSRRYRYDPSSGAFRVLIKPGLH